MSGRKRKSRQTVPVKRLLDDLAPKTSSKSKSNSVAAARQEIATVEEGTPLNSHCSITVTTHTDSSSVLKRHEVAKNVEHGTSPEVSLLSGPVVVINQQSQLLSAGVKDRTPVTANSDFFYSPMYRRYFGLTPPNPRLCNPRLLEDYIDWYMNVYLEEDDLPWHWVQVGNAKERARLDEGEVMEEARRLASASAKSTTD